jgi:hypothetical protein
MNKLQTRQKPVHADVSVNTAEQYWAVRALTAEALLSARNDHYKELKYASFREQAARTVGCLALQCMYY